MVDQVELAKAKKLARILIGSGSMSFAWRKNMIEPVNVTVIREPVTALNLINTMLDSSDMGWWCPHRLSVFPPNPFERVDANAFGQTNILFARLPFEKDDDAGRLSAYDNLVYDDEDGPFAMIECDDGLDCYWRLANPVSPEHAVKLQKDIADRLHADQRAVPLNFYSRIPLTFGGWPHVVYVSD